jgi:hypothetical protein
MYCLNNILFTKCNILFTKCNILFTIYVIFCLLNVIFCLLNVIFCLLKIKIQISYINISHLLPYLFSDNKTDRQDKTDVLFKVG